MRNNACLYVRMAGFWRLGVCGIPIYWQCVAYSEDGEMKT